MDFTLRVVDSIQLAAREVSALKRFMQAMLNRFTVGSLRYGTPAVKKKYMTRLAMELTAYRKTGNIEHLRNIAVYAFLESYAPENKRFHDNPFADSATRGKRTF